MTDTQPQAPRLLHTGHGKVCVRSGWPEIAQPHPESVQVAGNNIGIVRLADILKVPDKTAPQVRFITAHVPPAACTDLGEIRAWMLWR